jgi:20S proteasome alpha/beta subunit
MNQAIVNDIHKKLQDYNCGVEVVVTGQDSTTNLCHIFLVGLSGVSFDKTDAGFATIGSGWSIATFTILQSGFNKSKKLTEIEALAKKVMQEASHAPGVGKLTESLVLPKTKPKE